MYNRLSNSQKQRTQLAFAKKREVKKKLANAIVFFFLEIIFYKKKNS
jgi:hypothetical protein